MTSGFEVAYALHHRIVPNLHARDGQPMASIQIVYTNKTIQGIVNELYRDEYLLSSPYWCSGLVEWRKFMMVNCNGMLFCSDEFAIDVSVYRNEGIDNDDYRPVIDGALLSRAYQIIIHTLSVLSLSSFLFLAFLSFLSLALSLSMSPLSISLFFSRPPPVFTVRVCSGFALLIFSSGSLHIVHNTSALCWLPCPSAQLASRSVTVKTTTAICTI